MESATIAASEAVAQTGEKGLKKDAIGFLDGLSIGVDEKEVSACRCPIEAGEKLLH